MALQQAITTPQGIDLPAAYIKILFFSGDKKHVQYVVRIWSSLLARQRDNPAIDEKNYSFVYSPGQGDILPACYADLMSRPEYATSQSILDDDPGTNPAPTPEEIAAAALAAKNAADTVAAKGYAKLTALQGMSPAQVQDWTTANVTTLAQVRDAITTLAIAVSVMARRL